MKPSFLELFFFFLFTLGDLIKKPPRGKKSVPFTTVYFNLIEVEF